MQDLIAKIPLTEQLSDPQVSSLNRYRQKVFGEGHVVSFFEYEITTFLFGSTSGGLGYFARKLFYPRLFRKCGKGVILGKGIVLRHPRRVLLGDRVAIDDFVLIDAGGAGEEGISMGDDVIISRSSVIQGKLGPISIGSKTDIGCNTIISSTSGTLIGESVLIAANNYIGGGRYVSERLDIPMIEQGVYSEGNIVIGNDVWLGAGVTVLDGVRIGNGCIVGAGAVVNRDLPDYTVAAGVPAKAIRLRGQAQDGGGTC